MTETSANEAHTGEPFVSQLRARQDVITVGDASGGAAGVLHLRVQLAEAWDAVRVEAPAGASVASVKLASLAELGGAGADPATYVTKLRGFEVLDENASLAEAGVVEGSTLFLQPRRRRPVR